MREVDAYRAFVEKSAPFGCARLFLRARCAGGESR